MSKLHFSVKTRFANNSFMHELTQFTNIDGKVRKKMEEKVALESQKVDCVPHSNQSRNKEVNEINSIVMLFLPIYTRGSFFRVDCLLVSYM